MLTTVTVVAWPAGAGHGITGYVPGEAGGERMTTAEPPGTGLVAVLVSDLVDSTVILTRLGERENDRYRQAHFSLLRSAVTAHQGEEVKTTGDGIMAVFPSASSAVGAAIDIQR